jgi:predicted DNA-binding transcriptional regulator YafY
LDAGKVHTSEFVQELGVHIRSVQRYITIIDETDFPITQLEPPGTYSFVDGFSLKSADTTNTEISMLVSLSDIVKKLGKDFEKSFAAIKQKVLFPKKESPFI